MAKCVMQLRYNRFSFRQTAIENMYGWVTPLLNCRQTSNISRTVVDNKIADHSDVDGVSSVGAAPITSSFTT